jgi:hypothetical protein
MILHRGYSTQAGVAMTAAGDWGHVGGMSDDGGSEVWWAPAGESFWKNVRTKRTKRTKPVVMGKMRSVLRPACQVGVCIGILSAEENAAVAAGRSEGMEREGNGHGI